MTPDPVPQCDVAIVGGSFAGLSAALMLARARKSVVLFDEGGPRNRFAAHAHSVIGHDGKPPAELLGEALDQLMRYPSVAPRITRAVSAARTGEGFVLTGADGHRVHARRVILATGVRDLLPAMPGLAARWGRTVLHCPYCHGYEVADRPLAVLGNVAHSVQQAMLISEWGPTTYLTQGQWPPDAGQVRQLARLGVAVEHTPMICLEDGVSEANTVRLADGRGLQVAAVFTAPHNTPVGDLHQQLGCAMEDGPLGPLVKVDAMQQTSTAGVFAAGDMAGGMQAAPLAIAAGTKAGAAAHRSLLEDDMR